MNGWWRGAAVVAAGLMWSGVASAQSGPSASMNAEESVGPDSVPIVRGYCSGGATLVIDATHTDGAVIDIDGVGSEPVWGRAAIATDFVQYEPEEGESASERTEARVVYGDDALYVLLRAFDSQPAQIVGQLTRRDQMSHSDMLGVVIDSYFDKRTAFHFAVNPVGVKHDIYRFDDTKEDAGWDAVWDVATTRDADGWTAEFRIPYP